MMSSLWIKFTRTNFFENVINDTFIVGFQQMNHYLDEQDQAKYIYAKNLIKMAAEMEANYPTTRLVY
ncbi:unnamed protein product [Mucor hiemalis]